MPTAAVFTAPPFAMAPIDVTSKRRRGDNVICVTYRVTWPTRRYTSTQPPPTHASAGVEGPPQDPAPLVEEVGTARAK